MKIKDRHDLETISQGDFANLIGVCLKTVSRWRKDGRIVTLPSGRTEVILLKSLNTSGSRRHGGKVLIPMSHSSYLSGFHLLGAAEFVEALGAFDPALALMELELLEL